MSKKPILTAILSVFFSVLMGQGLPFEIDFTGCVTDCRPDSIATFKFNLNTDSIKNNLTTFTYNDDSSLVRYKYFGLNSFNQKLIYFGYGYSISDDFCNEIENAALQRDFEFGDYYGYNRFYYFQPNSNKIDSSLVLFRSGGAPNHYWDNSRKTHWKYNADDKIQEILYFNWVGYANPPYWGCEDKEMHTYDSLDNKLITYFESNNGDNWVPKYTRKYIYDSAQRVTEEIYASLITNHGIYKQTYDYSFQDSVVRRNFLWDSLSTEWTLVSVSAKIYDINNRLSYTNSNPLNYPTSNWGKKNYAYINDSDCISNYLYSTSTDGIYWEKNDSKVYYYPNSLGINNELNRFNFDLFPNPTDDDFTVFSPIGAMLKIINSQGQIILQTTANESITHINMRNQPAGVYCVRVQIGNSFSAKLLVKM
jgi:hypothetical protein